MRFLALGFLLLVLFPVVIVLAFRAPLVKRKETELLNELNKLEDEEFIADWGGEEGIRQEIQDVYSFESLSVPALLLTFLYGVGFLALWSFLNLLYGEGSAWPFTDKLLLAGRPVMMTFFSAYLFNVGTTIRRLYLSDLTENVFWASINRLLLSVGLAVLLATAYGLGDAPEREIQRFYYFIFFAAGFLTNNFLEWALEKGIELVNIFKPKSKDLPLQMVQGIDMWKEYRLEEEGIENVQNLATAEVVTLAVKTHYNIRTLVDWVDQAILIDRLGEAAGKLLREKGLIAGAIDLAWKSPQNNEGSLAGAERLAAAAEKDPHAMADLMNNLFEDEHVRTLWTLWQTRFDPRRQNIN
jgi:hypothetical protein